MDDPILDRCNKSYIPTSEQYRLALGSYGTSIVIIGGLVTLGLFILFFEQAVYTNQTAHSSCKRHIYWIASVFPLMTLMSLIALMIPRAHNICMSVKMVYMSIGISHFTDLTMVMFGGEELLLERSREDTFNLRLSPLCCCCKCLPRPPVTKYSLRLVVLLTDQLPFIQSIYYVTILVLLSDDNITLGDVTPAGAYLWLNLVKLASVMFGVYGFMILSSFSRIYLHGFQYAKKSRVIHVLVLVTNFQLLIFNIMGNYNAFPCIPPYISPPIYKQTLDNSLYLLEMMILGPYCYWQYHDLQFASPVTYLSLHDSSHSSSISPSSFSRLSMNSSHRDSRASSNSTTVTETSNGSSEKSNSTNRTNGRATNEMGNGDVAIDCDNRDRVITTQVTSILNSPWNSQQGSNSSNSRLTSGSGGLLASSDGVRGSQINDASNNGLHGCSNRNGVNSSNNRFFAGTESHKERTTSRDISENGFVFVTCDKEIRSSKRKTSKKTSTTADIDKTSASSRSKTKSRSGSTSSKISSSSKRKSESASKGSKKSAKVSEKHKSRRTTATFNNNLSSIDEKDNNTKNNTTTTLFPTPTDKSSNSTFNTSNILSSLAISPGLLNKAKSLSHPNLRDRKEYERLS